MKQATVTTRKTYAQATRTEGPAVNDGSSKPPNAPGQHADRPKVVKRFDEETHRAAAGDNTIEVKFEVLLSREMNVPGSQLVILFGHPLSDWETPLVAMRPVDVGVEIDDGAYTLMRGQLAVHRSLVGKTIPYKYVVQVNKN
jgi:hypothetical protein